MHQLHTTVTFLFLFRTYSNYNKNQDYTHNAKCYLLHFYTPFIYYGFCKDQPP